MPLIDADPITLEVMRSALASIADEMAAGLMRTAYSTNIKDRRDHSCAIYTVDGDVVAMSEFGGTPLHLGTMHSALRTALDAYPVDTLAPGDVLILNTPFPAGPGHLNDICLIAPVFVTSSGEDSGGMPYPAGAIAALSSDMPSGEDSRGMPYPAGAIAALPSDMPSGGARSMLLGFVANQAHHVDVGGFAPGSMPFGVSEVYQEGLQIPPLKLARRGEVDEQLIRFIGQNVRTPRESRGDLMAQLAAIYVGQQRLAELADKYGFAMLRLYLAEMLNYGERRMRDQLRTIPPGVYEYADFIEGDGIDDRLVRLAVRITVEGDRIVADFSATDDQVRGPLNCRWPSVAACVYYVLKGILDPDIPANAGAYRPIEIITRTGSVLGAVYPAAVCNANIITTQRMVDVLLGALLAAVPERVCAACSGTMNLLNIGGLRPDTGDYYNYIETYAGGQGATFDRDGSDAVQNHMTNTRNAPVEVIESAYPLRIVRYGLVADSEGAGRYRGGAGLVREFLCLGDYVRLTLSSDRQDVHPWGVQGGQAAAGSRCYVVKPNGESYALKSKVTTTVRQGDRVVTVTPGGGGWGEPTQREPARVAWDVKEGIISPERAKQLYGATDD